MEEANEQQQELLSALQDQILLLEERLEKAAPTPAIKAEGTAAEPARAGVLLWVDDSPKNNATIVAHIRGLGIEVEQVRSTKEALAKFKPGRYARIVTDMGRRENGSYIADAGLRLLRQLKKAEAELPVIVYTGRRGVDAYGEAALSAGAKVVTDTPVVLMEALNLKELRSSNKAHQRASKRRR